MTSLTVKEAILILYKGQSNVKLMANSLGISLEALQKELNDYVARTPIDEDDWMGDVNPSWPYWT